MLTFRVRAFAILLAFSAFALVYISVGIRWHTYRARAGLYARQEVEHTFQAANFARAARDPGDSPETQARAREYRRLAKMHEKAARECTELREFYEACW
ncbi:hypothetical protein P12x_005728 [Tundrisphaera lichenicola]|uniref:hypothetical protein n=1 Tax=Tundrisphaera lichenicola TaxID=2029860 RepID=UPI003EB7A1EB